MTAALITEADANPSESAYIAAELSRAGVRAMQSPGTRIPAGDGGDVRILVPFVATPVTSEVMDHLPRLALITTRSTGTDHIDTAEAARRGITVANVPDYGSVAVAEHTFALLLTLTRIRPHLEPGTDLSGKTIGVIGTGAIGRHVMQIAHGFGMNVLAHDLERRPGIPYAALEEVLARADVITLHIPATPATRHFISEQVIAAMKPGVILINTARGSLIDTAALSRALHSGQVSAAGLDVAETGTDADAGISLPNTVITPHVAYNTREAIRRISDITLDNIRRWLSKDP
jgi:D-lactate dehydrogenase